MGTNRFSPCNSSNRANTLNNTSSRWGGDTIYNYKVKYNINGSVNTITSGSLINLHASRTNTGSLYFPLLT
ncbi:hypothetical protein QUF90_16695 [Desulfococcaceae bacterium HSG9]|nr:hypothetical protein [Desulfococcaceae bacterium HSG9]